jgi:hypothetical protein
VRRLRHSEAPKLAIATWYEVKPVRHPRPRKQTLDEMIRHGKPHLAAKEPREAGPDSAA